MFRRCLGSAVWRLVDVFEVLACRWFKSEKRGFALEGRGYFLREVFYALTFTCFGGNRESGSKSVFSMRFTCFG